MENQFNNQPGSAAQDSTSYSQDSAQNSSSNQGKGGMMGALSNIQVPQSVKDLGTTVSRSYTGMSTTQKVLGGAALLGASYWVASNQGWIGQAKMPKLGKSGKKNKAAKNQYSSTDQHTSDQHNS